MILAFVQTSAAEHLGVAASAIVALGGVGALSAVLLRALWETREARRMGERAAAAGGQGSAPLTGGPAVVFGAVELAEDEAVAARVEVDQTGVEQESSGSWTTRWTEKDRRVTMRPFYVRHRDQRVRVEPGEAAFLVDAMDGLILADATHRTRYAELSPGEEVFAVGQLEAGHDPERRPRGYRDADKGWVLRARHGEDLLLSSEPLDRRYRRRASTHRKVALLASAVLAIAGAIFGPYAVRAALGTNEVGAAIDRERHVDEDNVTRELRVRMADGETLMLECDEDAYAKAPGIDVPVRYVRAWPRASVLGQGPTVHGATIIALLMLFGLLGGVRWVIRRAGLAWYERSVVDSADGRLSENGSATSM
jgi:hypothetical protein